MLPSGAPGSVPGVRTGAFAAVRDAVGNGEHNNEHRLQAPDWNGAIQWDVTQKKSMKYRKCEAGNDGHDRQQEHTPPHDGSETGPN